MKTKPKTLEVITGWPDHPEGSGNLEMTGDYYTMQLVVDGKVVLDLSDSYHDKADVQVDAWLECFKWTYGKLPKVKYTNVLAEI